MSSTPASPHGFTTVWGRGYRPAQADQHVTALERERDEAHAEAERLTALAERLGAEAAALAETVATLPEPAYDNLGERAQRLYALVQEQSEALDAAGRAEAAALTAAAEQAADDLREA
ncbi:cellulose-binding protein, partial [Streptomyces sp. SID8455]|nr:cellulose-binding protein [Streptomyces sp. SID8455]